MIRNHRGLLLDASASYKVLRKQRRLVVAVVVQWLGVPGGARSGFLLAHLSFVFYNTFFFLSFLVVSIVFGAMFIDT